MKYCFYRMQVDSGFAPNPYHRYCTLAACTPNHMRANLKQGDVIVGVEADGLVRRRRSARGTGSTTSRCMVYYMVVEEVLDLDSYFRDSRFAAKKAIPDSRRYARRKGDNVYYRIGSRFCAIPGNAHDNAGSFQQDTKGDRVYVSKRDDFYYFGDVELEFPSRFERYLPKGHGIKYWREPLPELDDYVRRASRTLGRKGRIGNPISKASASRCD